MTHNADCDAPEACDPDCEIGPVHCPNLHLPQHKHHVHAAEAAQPERCACGNEFDGDNFCMPSACQWEGAPTPPGSAGERIVLIGHEHLAQAWEEGYLQGAADWDGIELSATEVTTANPYRPTPPGAGA